MPSHNELLDIKVRAGLEAYDIVHSTMECEPEYADTTKFCQHYNFTPEQSANTIIVAGKSNPTKFVACVILATTKLDVNKKVCELLEVRRASFARLDDTTRVTGMEFGGVTVFGLPNDLPVYVDAEVILHHTVVMGGGNRSSKLILDPRELKKLPNVKVIKNLAHQK